MGHWILYSKIIETSTINIIKLLTFSIFTTKSSREVSHRFPTENRCARVVGCFSEGLCNVVDVEAEQMKQLQTSYSIQGCFTQLLILFRHQLVYTARVTTAEGVQGGCMGRELWGSGRCCTVWDAPAWNQELSSPENPNVFLAITGRGCTSLRERSKTISLVQMETLLWHSLWYSASRSMRQGNWGKAMVSTYAWI